MMQAKPTSGWRSFAGIFNITCFRRPNFALPDSSHTFKSGEDFREVPYPMLHDTCPKQTSISTSVMGDRTVPLPHGRDPDGVVSRNEIFAATVQKLATCIVSRLREEYFVMVPPSKISTWIHSGRRTHRQRPFEPFTPGLTKRTKISMTSSMRMKSSVFPRTTKF